MIVCVCVGVCDFDVEYGEGDISESECWMSVGLCPSVLIT